MSNTQVRAEIGLIEKKYLVRSVAIVGSHGLPAEEQRC